ncbi:MAG: hypothetical protein JRF63_14295, partial [Deltaproteobacteria bacterium]|nr:hypothetical protein [Deltaproteobacteria bacterium]
MSILRFGMGIVCLAALALAVTGCGASYPKKTAPEGTKEIAASDPGAERERKRGRERERGPAERLIPELPQMSRAEFEQKITMLVAVDDVDLVTSEMVERYLSEEDIPPMFQGGLELLLHFVLGPSLASACDLSQPAALAIGGDEATGDYRMLVGIRLRRNAGDSLAGAFDLVPLGRDVVLLRPREQEGLGVLGSQFDCVVNTSKERPPYLVCGTPADELGRLAPHVTEWIAKRPRGPVVSLELSSSFLTQVLLDAAGDDPLSEDPSEALGEAMAIQWFESLGKIVLLGELVANGLAVDLALHQPRDGGVIGALFNAGSAEGSAVQPE